MGGAVAVVAGPVGRASQYKGRVTWQVIVACLVASSGGVLFGYDNGIAGGVVALRTFKERFFPDMLDPADDTSPYCKNSNPFVEVFISCIFLSGAAAALWGGWTTKHWGRRATIIMAGASYLVGAILQAAGMHIAMLIVGRLVLGVGVGLAVEAIPLYLSETAPFHIRGAMNICFQLSITIGIWVAQMINYGINQLDVGYNWRISLGLAAVPALTLVFGTWCLSDTPNSLVERGHHEEAQHVLQKIRGTEEISAEYEDIVDAAAAAKMIANPWRNILKRHFRPQLVICLLVPAFQQLAGINAIMFYSPLLFSSMGHDDSGALLNSMIIGAVNVGATLIAIAVVDRLGRRALLIEGGTQMAIAQLVIGAVLGTQFSKYGPQLPDQVSAAIIFLICLYVMGYAWSWGPLCWLIPSEIQTLETRSAGFAIVVAVNFIFTFLIGQAFPSMLCGMRFGVFWFFAGFLVLMTLFVWLCVPETKGLPLEEVSLVLRNHWFWGPLVQDTSCYNDPAALAAIAAAAAAAEPAAADGMNKGLWAVASAVHSDGVEMASHNKGAAAAAAAVAQQCP